MDSLEVILRSELGKKTNSGISLLNIIKKLQDEGMSFTDAKKTVLENAATRDVQKSWADWSGIAEREELKLRLEALMNCEEPDIALTDFITFFFRASDPEMYQQAALTLGKHLKSNELLSKYLLTYTKNNGINLSIPFELNNQRMVRRLLLAASSSLVYNGQNLDVSEIKNNESSFPLEISQIELKDLSNADLNALLIALKIYNQNKKANSALKDFSVNLLKHISLHSESISERVIFRNFGILLDIVDIEQNEKLKIWQSLFNKLLSSYDSGNNKNFEKRVSLLNNIDELIRCIAFMNEIADEKYVTEVCEKYPESTSVFVKYRYNAWMYRENGKAYNFSQTTDNAEFESLLKYLNPWKVFQSDSYSGLTGDLRSVLERELLKKLLIPFKNVNNWEQYGIEERALTVFLLTDLSLYHHLEPAMVRAIFITNTTLTEKQLQVVKAFKKSIQGHANYFTYCVIILINEISSKVNFVFKDKRLLHQLDGEQILLSLLQNCDNQEDLSVLADICEHYIRFQLLANKEFEPEWFLQKLLSKKPEPAFFKHLKRITENRIYKLKNDQEFPLSERINSILPEYELKDCTELLNAVMKGDQTKQGLRQSLLNIYNNEDPIESVKQLCNNLNADNFPDLTVKENGITELIRHIHSDVIGGNGNDYYWNDKELSESIISLTDFSVNFTNGLVNNLEEADEKVQNISYKIEYINKVVYNLLPVYEAKLFRCIIHQIQNSLKIWLKELHKLQFHWREAKKYGPARVIYEIETYFKGFPEIRDKAIRRHLITVLFNEMFDYAINLDELTERELYTNDAWYFEFEILRWISTKAINILASEDEKFVLDLVSERWNLLMKEAIKGQYERRVIRLLKEPAFIELRLHSENITLLPEVHSWLLDRLHPVDAARTRATDYESRLRFFVKMLDFTTHFSPVWIALVIGVILMLDFGDAWMSMAEAADITGITLTFILGVCGSFLYTFYNLNKKTRIAPEDNLWKVRISRLVRVTLFIVYCVIFTFVITSLLWYLLSGTDAVLHGDLAKLHIIVWTGFALFVGVFFGLLAKN